MHEETALGRELYQLGLDFYLHDIEPARNRLLEIVHVLSDACNENFINTIVDKWTNERGFEKINKNDVDKFIHEELEGLKDLKRKSLHDNKYHEFYENEFQKFCENVVKGDNCSPGILLEAYQKSAEEDIRRILTKLQGLKLKQLLEILEDLDGRERLVVEPLRSVLKIRDQPKNSENPLSQGFHPFLFQAFSKEEIKKDDQPFDQWSCPDTYLISRICSTSSLEHTRDRCNAYRSWSCDENGKIIFGPPVKSKSDKNGHDDEMKHYENYQVLLGRYDWLTIRKIKPMCRYGIPRFPSKNNEPIFLNNFTRREMALPVRLGTKSSWDDVHKWDYANGNHSNHNIFALISIKLNRYTARLDFLTHLLHVTREGNTEDRDLNKNPCNLNQLKGYILEDYGDRAFLTDGWGDILLILGNERLGISTNSKNKNDGHDHRSGHSNLQESQLAKVDSDDAKEGAGQNDDQGQNDHEVEWLKDIFKIQSVLFEDFQVNRTELILTPKCLDIAVRRLDLFSVTFQFRLMGDCTLEQANRNCVKSLQESIEKNLKKEEKPSGIKFNIHRIPGRMDYMIQLEKVDGCGYKPLVLVF